MPTWYLTGRCRVKGSIMAYIVSDVDVCVMKKKQMLTCMESESSLWKSVIEMYNATLFLIL